MEQQFIILTQESYNIIQSNLSQDMQQLLQLKVFLQQKLLFKNQVLIAVLKINTQNIICKVKVYIDVKLNYKHIPINIQQQIPTIPAQLGNLNKYTHCMTKQSIENFIQECHWNFKSQNTSHHVLQANKHQQKFHSPYSFELGLDQDSLTKKQKINFPYIMLFEDSLRFNPLICDQDGYVLNIIEANNTKQSTLQTKYSSLQFNKNENYQLLLFWKVRSILQNSYKQSKFQFIIYPKHGNFAILKDQKLFFINQSHQITFLRNNYQSENPQCNPIQNKIKQGEIVKIHLFESTDSETILDQKSKYIDLEQSQCHALSIHMDEKKCQEYFTKLQSENLQNFKKSIQVFCKQYPYIYSTVCGHQIVLDQDNYCPICQQNIYDYGSIFIEEPFYQYYKSIQEQIFEIGKYPPIFIDPFTIVYEMDLYGNIYYLAQLRDKEQNTIYTIKRTFLSLNPNIYMPEDQDIIENSNYDDRFNALLEQSIQYENEYEQEQEQEQEFENENENETC